MRRIAALPITALLIGLVSAIGWSGPASAAGGMELTYQIKDARAYAYKASIPEQVIKVAPKCDPKTDKYHCDSYITKPNCPTKVDFGPRGKPSPPKPPAGVDGVSGGSGEGAGEDPEGTGVPQSSAVRLNRLLTHGALGRLGTVLQSNGLSSLQYVELGSPPWGEVAAHTETDAFTNQDNYQERCFPEEQVKDKRYVHLWTHSYDDPETYEFGECFEDQCQFNGGPLTPTAEHGVSEVHLYEAGGIVHGDATALLEGFNLGGEGALTIDQLQTYVHFESDGTPAGLKWKVVSTSSGAKLGGQPIAIPQGRAIVIGVGDQAISVGMAGPYVTTEKDGSTLEVVAPGMFVATSQQTAFFAGAEVTGNFGQSPNTSFPTLPPRPPNSDTSGGSVPPTGSGGTTDVGSSGGGPGFLPNTGGEPTSGIANASPQLALISKQDPPWAPVTIVALGVLGLLFVVLHWVQQFEWGRRMYEVQPMRSFQRLYRSFVKT